MSVALVLSGGGARGAYEIGVLSVLLPELERRGERPSIVVGTSVGAFNTAYVAANAHRPLEDALADGIGWWTRLRFRDILEPITSPRAARPLSRYVGMLLGVKRARVEALLDPSPLTGTLSRVVSFPDLRRNLEQGVLNAAAVTTTSALTSRTVVFHTGGSPPERDEERGIDYVATQLTEKHVLASGAIPTLFPAVHVEQPERARGWYFDGGTRLNTPIKPALELGAERVVVIGLNSIASAPAEPLAGEHHPDVFDGAAQSMQGLLVDKLADDVRELAQENQPGEGGKPIPYIFVAPRERDGVGKLASRIYRERYAGVRGLRRDRDVSTLGRFIGGGEDPVHGELLSFLFFAPEFAGALVDMGREDAQAWLSLEHDDGPWRLGPLPE